MKKILPVFFLLTFLVFPALVSAQQEAPVIFDDATGLIDMFDTVANWAFAILMALAAVFLIIGGIQFVTAQGSQEKVTSARNLLIWALVGVAVGVAAKGLVAVVRSILGG